MADDWGPPVGGPRVCQRWPTVGKHPKVALRCSQTQVQGLPMRGTKARPKEAAPLPIGRQSSTDVEAEQGQAWSRSVVTTKSERG
jgi:hypothetical protein